MCIRDRVLPSLKKDSIDEFLKGLLPDTKLLIEPKIDGCAVALQYREGTLEKAISRNGTDVTSKLIKVQDIPNHLPLRGVLQVRGELYSPNQTPNISQRIASGFLRAKEGFSESLSFCAFQIINSTLNQYESKKSLSKQYRDGTLEKAISRKGADITSKLIKVQDLSLIHISEPTRPY